MFFGFFSSNFLVETCKKKLSVHFLKQSRYFFHEKFKKFFFFKAVLKLMSNSLQAASKIEKKNWMKNSFSSSASEKISNNFFFISDIFEVLWAQKKNHHFTNLVNFCNFGNFLIRTFPLQFENSIQVSENEFEKVFRKFFSRKFFFIKKYFASCGTLTMKKLFFWSCKFFENLNYSNHFSEIDTFFTSLLREAEIT